MPYPAVQIEPRDIDTFGGYGRQSVPGRVGGGHVQIEDAASGRNPVSIVTRIAHDGDRKAVFRIS
jgi:hypothetical protein